MKDLTLCSECQGHPPIGLSFGKVIMRCEECYAAFQVRKNANRQAKLARQAAAIRAAGAR